MVEGHSAVDSAVLAMLELLSGTAQPHEYDTAITHAVTQGADPAVLHHAKRVALDVAEQLTRHRHREADFTALVDTAREFTIATDVDTLLKMITRRTRLLLGVDMAYISLPDGDSIHIRTADGHTSVLSVGLRLPGAGGVGNEVLLNAAPFWTADYLNDPRIHHSPAIDEVVEAEGLRTVMAVPLFSRNTPFGALYAASRTVRRFTTDEVSLMSSLGDLAGVAIERAQLQEHSDDVITRLREHQTTADTAAATIREFTATHARMLELVIDGADLTTVLTEAHHHLGGSLRLTTTDSRILVSIGELPDDDPDALTAAMITAHTGRTPTRAPDGLWTMPLHAGNRHLGALLLRPDHEPGEHERGLIQVAAHAATTYLLLDNHADASDDRLRDELLDDLLAQPQRPPHQILKRALRMGIDLTNPHTVVLVRPEGDALGKVSIWASAYSHRRGGMKTLHHDRVVLLIPGDDADTAARAVHDSVSASVREPTTVAASNPVTDAAAILPAHHEATRCLTTMTALGMAGRASSTAQLGFLGILLSDHHDVDGFVHATIGPVLDYDRLRDTELTRTLEAYFAESGSPTHAAKKLHVHANTVARRLERITELLGPDWQHPTQALEVQLALRLNRVRAPDDQPA
ncbi:helix-turn-helix domain-containing protein [Actinokineospora auranticolor]|uniref:GAF domain-containing protein n=1 Tax=Actinokineospora auranticolor TaxID=155976 RepID=A0A2S6GJ96_9PSEU|nr:helix-turn-helix domain-containing protein [Actinokineospora auranticolor]PPK65304.1 GAF domain-containing protein [Actinokineospora auranticolor]